MAERNMEQPGRIPSWASAPLAAFLDDQETAGKLLHLCMRGISVLRAMPTTFDALAAVDPTFGSEEAQAKRVLMEEEAALARREVDAQFPILHAQAVVSLWASLEAAVRHFLANWIRENTEVCQTEPFKKLRIRLGEYEALAPEQRALLVVDILEQDLGAPLKPGLGRFEALLDTIGLGGGVSEGVRRGIYELSQLRNVLVHSRGIADRRFVEQCPWLGLAVGDAVVITHEHFGRLNCAALAYATELAQRVRVKFGQTRHENLDASRTRLERVLGGA